MSSSCQILSSQPNPGTPTATLQMYASRRPGVDLRNPQTRQPPERKVKFFFTHLSQPDCSFGSAQDTSAATSATLHTSKGQRWTRSIWSLNLFQILLPLHIPLLNRKLPNLADFKLTWTWSSHSQLTSNALWLSSSFVLPEGHQQTINRIWPGWGKQFRTGSNDCTSQRIQCYFDCEN